MSVTDRSTRSEEFEQIIAGAFRKAGMRVKRPVSAVDDGADLVYSLPQQQSGVASVLATDFLDCATGPLSQE
jgi:hypothetical protein